MKFSHYQKLSRSTSDYPRISGASWMYPALGLVGAAGKVADKSQKILGDNNGIFTINDVEEIGKELGDVLWSMSQICTELRISLDDVAKVNLEKLQERKAR